MIQIRMMKEEDMEAIHGDEALKPLFSAEPWGDVYCIIAEEGGNIVGGLSGSTRERDAALQVCIVGDVRSTTGTVLTEGLIRSILYVLDKRGVDRAYLMMDAPEAVRQKIGFAPIDPAKLPGWINSDRKEAWTIDIKEFLARDCRGCGHAS